MFLPHGLQIFGDDEVAFFRRVTPIPEIEVYEQIALAYHVLIPAIIEDDLDEFGAGLDRLSAIGLKGREISNQPETVRRAISALRKYAPCVGMSSMGPLVFAISRQPLSDSLTDLPPGTQYLGTTSFAREGHTVTYG